ncbi:unnamed protein product [Cylindrotheca closterium]|uniref:G-protein coupled receptors family 3 profile domain-containing protein n=1 Tax=Cylindrotheca closterium TaxID=2856 RepID=A0AAD2PX72_9STRA|nr:unnamed protein product [Cylindrotheca closterium]
MKLILLGLLLGTLPATLAQQHNFTYSELQPCPMGSFELATQGPKDVVKPCILYDVQPPNVSNSNATSSNNNSHGNTTTIAIVQVTPSSCSNHRDGAVIRVQKMNAENNGKGWVIGFNSDHYLQFRLVSVVAGNDRNLTEATYQEQHQSILGSMISTLNAPYIIGSCSGVSNLEKSVALEKKAILMAQVGPPGFYTDRNPYVFGFHINSDIYPLANVQALQFLADARNQDPSQFPVSVISRTKSEFFQSTCRSAISSLQSSGFSNLTEYFYDHAADEDGDGDINQFDEDYLQGLADAACPPGSGDIEGFHPALFLCTLTEQDILIPRLMENGCSPTSIWLTAATWTWATNNPDVVPYYQGGGQWHPAFDYADSYFESGQALLESNQKVYGYAGSYDQVVSYAIPAVFAEHLVSHYQLVDVPDPMADLQNEEAREFLRRELTVLNTDTLFGPVRFNRFQRNNGRDAAATQWQPLNDDRSFRNGLVSPLLQAEAQTVIPSLNALECEAGSFVNNSLIEAQGALLLNTCSGCPLDTFTKSPSRSKQCEVCPEDSTTVGLDTNEYCVYREDNLLPTWMLALAYILVTISWCLSLFFAIWLFRNRKDAVVRVGQIEFLLLLCFGAILSSATVVALSMQAGTGEDTRFASTGCALAPFFYAIGWVLQYGCLSAKTYRLYQVMQNANRIKRKTTGAMWQILFACMLVDIIIMICWGAINPLEYQRTDGTSSVDEITATVTISSVGRCVGSNPDSSPWYFAGPLLAFHVALMVSTNILLYKVKGISDRYQEGKYVGLASVLMFEILIVGIPVFIAVSDNSVAVFVVLTGFITLADISILCCIFVPKIMFSKKGLNEGISVGESILKKSLKKAETRESMHRTFSQAPSRFSSASKVSFASEIMPNSSGHSERGRITQEPAENPSESFVKHTMPSQSSSANGDCQD